MTAVTIVGRDLPQNLDTTLVQCLLVTYGQGGRVYS